MNDVGGIADGDGHRPSSLYEIRGFEGPGESTVNELIYLISFNVGESSNNLKMEITNCDWMRSDEGLICSLIHLSRITTCKPKTKMLLEARRRTALRINLVHAKTTLTDIPSSLNKELHDHFAAKGKGVTHTYVETCKISKRYHDLTASAAFGRHSNESNGGGFENRR
ncbi:hypothetical protein SCHPADRAFT_895478 [Schizopora paradoxa]|uniref:Uncharacterized protein n=1 Tax=Schizopora paradoxa TaxID=27342 RepID=A0A0H2R3K6_9AGAM|nr:hypothetical protein SCHPADRAFT_895478 [Schizopora paradoxa]